ncbi:aminoacyl-tRNA hydrolase [Candidatus Parcubacteria bacterium]|nr:aminoacyl-tRNA hydrolase [Candidatus Parcubacteria bacterium]
MKLIVGIGNPEEQYKDTRHNIGFMFLDYVAKKVESNSFELDKNSNALVSKSKIDKTPVVFAKPLSYVNKSGDVVGKLAKMYKVKPQDVIIVQDDLDIEFGSFKNSFNKNSGGHKGIESIIKALKTKEFYRLRIGIAVKALHKARQQSENQRDEFVQDFVLSKFSKNDQDTVDQMFKEIYERLLMLLKQ